MTTVESAKCFRCGKTQHSPVAFKVECSECHRYWHHRCHIPPISDNELIARVRASTVNDVDNGLAGWICRDCLGGMGTSRKPRPAELSRTANSPQSAAQSSNSTTSDPQTLPSRLPPAKKDPPVLKYKQSMVQKRLVSSRPSDRNNKLPSTSGQTRSETSNTLRQAPYPEDLRHIRPPSSRTISADDSHAGSVFPTQNVTMNPTEIGSISESLSSVSGKVRDTVVDGGQLSKQKQASSNNHQPGSKGSRSTPQTHESAEPVHSNRKAPSSARSGLSGQNESRISNDHLKHGGSKNIVAPPVFNVDDDDDIQEVPNPISGPRTHLFPASTSAPSPIPSSSPLSTPASVRAPLPVQSLTPISPPSHAEQYLRHQLDLPCDKPVNLWALENPSDKQKPNQPYRNLIMLAIFGSPTQTLRLKEIYRAFIDRFEWFKDHSNEMDWKNAIRHSLSDDNTFVALARPVTEPDKGEYWCLNLSQITGTHADDLSHLRSPQTAFVADRSPEPQLPTVQSLSSLSSALQSTQLREQSLESGVNAPSAPAVQGMDEDVNMEDDEDEDDLYGPLPEEVQLVPGRHESLTPDMEVGEIEGQPGSASQPLEQASNQSANNQTRETSWMHGRFAHATGDPWDRLLRHKRSPVVSRPRVKVQARKLDNNHTFKENLVNFSIDEWIRTKRSN